MIKITQGIPLSIYPYSSSSQIVHWMTDNHGIISTIAKSAMKAESPFLGTYGLFMTSELSFFYRQNKSIYEIKECKVITPRKEYNSNWKAMRVASYITYLFYHVLPDQAPDSELFNDLEYFLDLGLEYGDHAMFIIWSELYFTKKQGNKPTLNCCVICKENNIYAFSPKQGGALCKKCCGENQSDLLYFPNDVQNILQFLQEENTPSNLDKIKISNKQNNILQNILADFMKTTFHIKPQNRNAALAI